MITDAETNFLYLADTLKQKYVSFANSLEKLLIERNIDFGYLPNTKDVWARDYMPIQIAVNEFIKFDYFPDYLTDTIKWRKTISDAEEICRQLNFKPQISSLIIDGGNIVKGDNLAIVCDKIFSENPNYNPKKLIAELEKILEVKVIVVPTHPEDKIGHADGILRMYDENTVLINDFSKEPDLKKEYLKALGIAGLKWIEVPYNPYQNKKMLDAAGIYINYLQMKNNIVLPSFNKIEDEIVFRLFEQLFPKERISVIESSTIAEQGGVLNCITWNILKT